MVNAPVDSQAPVHRLSPLLAGTIALVLEAKLVALHVYFSLKHLLTDHAYTSSSNLT